MTNTLAKRQQQLLDFLQGTASVAASEIKSHILNQGGIDADTRLAIYKNAYNIRLRDTIDTDHPVLGIYLGDDLYDIMIEKYVIKHPSHNFSLRNFSDQLPEFLAQNTPFNEHPQIAELARFERLLLTAFDAADAKRATVEQLQELPPQQWPDMTIRFHPSVQLFKSIWNVVDIWKKIKADQTPPLVLNQQQTWLVWRNDEQLTEFRPMNEIAYNIFILFQQGYTFSQTCESLLDNQNAESIGEESLKTLFRWLEHGIISEIISI